MLTPSPSQMSVELGEARPPDFVTELVLIVDINGFVSRPTFDFKPFHKMARIVRIVDDLADTLAIHHEKFCVVLILPRSTQPAVEAFIRDHILAHRNVTRLHLFFIDGNASAMVTNDKPHACHPIDSLATHHSRVACRDANGRNIRYWRERQHYHVAQGNFGAADGYLRQIKEWLPLQREFTRRLEKENLLETA
jgi:hypothetical protein